MKIYLKTIIPITAILFAISACNVEGSKEHLLTSESWKLIASETVDFFDTIDNFARLKACERDNLYNFLPDQNLEIDEGPTKCKQSDPQTYIEGTWTFSNLETQITINEIEYFVQEFTEKRFRILADIQENGRTATIELTYGR